MVKLQLLFISEFYNKNKKILGKKKIKNPQIRKTMKKDMRQILMATSTENFEKCKVEYFTKLEKDKEIHFIKYLQQ